MLADDATVERQFLPFARRLLDHVDRAYTDDDIVAFVRRVVLAGDDPRKAQRDAFAAREVCVNHPHAAAGVVDAVVDGIKQEEVK